MFSDPYVRARQGQLELYAGTERYDDDGLAMVSPKAGDRLEKGFLGGKPRGSEGAAAEAGTKKPIIKIIWAFDFERKKIFSILIRPLISCVSNGGLVK